MKATLEKRIRQYVLSTWPAWLFGLAAAFYALTLVRMLRPFMFNPRWTTDDALQQLYPFYKVLNPALFPGDLITKMMECYLLPLHYWITAALTLLTRNPILAGHAVMLIQIVLALFFMFLAVRAAAGTAAGWAALLWLLHTRHVMQRLTGGLPRGWAAPLLTAYLYYVLKGSHRGVLAVLAIGCILHPMSALVCALAYGLLLLYRCLRRETRAVWWPKLKLYLLLSPLYLILVLSVVRMPAEIGRMVDYQTALQMPEFQSPNGRFPYTPLAPATFEIRYFGFMAFLGKFYKPLPEIRFLLPYVVAALVIGLLVLGWRRKRAFIPDALICYLIAIFCVYFASRLLAFRLYVPDRHLQFPLAMFFISALTIGAWRLGSGRLWRSTACVVAMLALTVIGSGTGLERVMKANFYNFNTYLDDQYRVFRWLRDHTPEDALIAGQPTHMDKVQLVAERSGFVTSETAHPFFDRYAAEMRRRLEINLKAYYAANLRELVDLLQPEGIDYFVFRRRDFRREVIAKATYYSPFEELMTKLIARPSGQYAFWELPQEYNPELYPFVVYRDGLAVVVDIRALREYLSLSKGSPQAENAQNIAGGVS